MAGINPSASGYENLTKVTPFKEIVNDEKKNTSFFESSSMSLTTDQKEFLSSSVDSHIQPFFVEDYTKIKHSFDTETHLIINEFTNISQRNAYSSNPELVPEYSINNLERRNSIYEMSNFYFVSVVGLHVDKQM